MTPKQLDTALKKGADTFDTLIDQLAAQVRAEHVIPFCDRKGWEFSAGMGSWSFHDKRGRVYSDWDNSVGIPKRLRDMLRQDTFLHNNSLGSLMESYRPKGFK
jgi:hypothetical protein